MFLVLSEGARDIGDGASEGAVRVLARRVLSMHMGRELAEWEVPGAPLPRPHHSELGPLKRMRLVLSTMKLFGAKAVAVVVDNDHTTGRLEAWQKARATLEVAEGAKPVAFGVAVETVEAWLLADESAINDSLAPEPRMAPISAPEDLWGKPRTEGHPKSLFTGQIGRATHTLEAPYDAVASRLRLAHVEARCPSFKAFVDELRAVCVRLRAPTAPAKE